MRAIAGRRLARRGMRGWRFAIDQYRIASPHSHRRTRPTPITGASTNAARRYR